MMVFVFLEYLLLFDLLIHLSIYYLHNNYMFFKLLPNIMFYHFQLFCTALASSLRYAEEFFRFEHLLKLLYHDYIYYYV